MKARILIIDDEPEQISAFARILEGEGYEVVLAEDDVEGLYLLDEFQPDLVILDIGFGHNERKGLDILKKILAKDKTIPVIMLTALNDDELEWKSLDLKAIDFVSKSRPTKALLARVKIRLPSILREVVVTCDHIETDLKNDVVRVRRDGVWHREAFEPKELDILKKLLSNSGWVIKREILEKFFPNADNPADTVYRYIRELRKKLEPDPNNPQFILTVRSVGYMFKECR